MNVAVRILIDGSHLNVQQKSSTNPETLVLDQSMSSEFGSDSHGINVYGRQGGNSHLKFYNSKGGSVCNVSTDGNLDVVKVFTSQRITGVTDTPPLKINNSSNNGWTVGQFESTLNNIGCLVEYKTFASSTSWWTGVWGTNTNEFKIWFNYKGLSITPTGDAVISGKLDVGPSQAQSNVKTYFNHVGSTGFMMMGGRYKHKDFLHFENKPQYGEMFLIVRGTYFL